MSDEELIARLRKADEYEPLGHDGWEAADRIEALVKARREDALELLAAHGQAQDAYEAQLKAEAQIAALTARVEGLTGALVAIDAMDPEDKINGFSESALRGTILHMGGIARAALAPTDAATEKGGDAHAVDPRHAPHEASPGVTAGADAAQAREAALHPDDMLPEAIRLIRQEASRDHSQEVVTGLKHIALLLEQLIGEART